MRFPDSTRYLKIAVELIFGVAVNIAHQDVEGGKSLSCGATCHPY
jgi:hypothetical protein